MQASAAAAVPRREAKWWPVLVLFGVILAMTMGGFVFAGEADVNPVAGEVELAEPVPVTEGVTIRPAAGWSVVRQVEDPSGIVLGGSGGNLFVGVPEGTGDATQLLGFYVSQVLEPQATQLSVGATETFPHPAGEAVRASYVGVFEGVAAPLEGEVIALVTAGGVPILFDGWAGEGLYVGVRGQVEAMVTSVAVG